MFTGPLFQTNLHLLRTVLLSGFQSSWELWNPPSKAIPGKFLGSGGHSKRNCVHYRANFHSSRAWQIVLVLTLFRWYDMWYMICDVWCMIWYDTIRYDAMRYDMIYSTGWSGWKNAKENEFKCISSFAMDKLWYVDDTIIRYIRVRSFFVCFFQNTIPWNLMW